MVSRYVRTRIRRLKRKRCKVELVALFWSWYLSDVMLVMVFFYVDMIFETSLFLISFAQVAYITPPKRASVAKVKYLAYR